MFFFYFDGTQAGEGWGIKTVPKIKIDQRFFVEIEKKNPKFE